MVSAHTFSIYRLQNRHDDTINDYAKELFLSYIKYISNMKINLETKYTRSSLAKNLPG